jgi:hypothetical protein
MITHILVPLDGSVLAESALSVAAQVTRALRGHSCLRAVARHPFVAYTTELAARFSYPKNSEIGWAMVRLRLIPRGESCGADRKGGCCDVS